jgi:hypothetical protein
MTVRTLPVRVKIARAHDQHKHRTTMSDDAMTLMHSTCILLQCKSTA